MKNLKKLFPLSIFLLLTNICFSQNIALHKRYAISRNVYYNVSTLDTTNTLLTDGVLSDNFGWTSPASVAWHAIPRVSIELDLQQISDIKSVSFHTSRLTNRVFFPANIFVFTSTDKKIYRYAGDVASDTVNNLKATPTNGVFTLPGINQHGRYVLFVVIPKGQHLYCDEIEVTEGNNTDKVQTTVLAQKVNAYIDTLKVHENVKIGNVRNGRLKLNARMQNSASGAFVVDKVNPWQKISKQYSPTGSDAGFDVTSVINGVQYNAFVLSNLTKNTAHIIPGLEADISSIAAYDLYSVPFVASGMDYQEIPDPLIKAGNGTTLQPGESRMFILKITGKKAGSLQTKIKINTGSNAIELPLKINIANIDFPKKDFALNACNWAYLEFPLISDRKDTAIQDLKNHHINTLVIPPDVIKKVGNTDFSSFANYMAQYGGAKNLMIAGAFTSPYNAGVTPATPFMSDQWKQNFVTWYSSVIGVATKAGYSPSNIYFYPYDEPQGKNIDDYNKFLSWVRTAVPNINIFGTLATDDAINKLLPSVDIGVIHSKAKFLPNRAEHTWLYDTDPGSETLSPYTYYRLMSWEAFANGFTGVGFWNYADYRDGSGNKALWSDFDGVDGNNYSVIYDGPGKEIISSRRWEAFKLGIEDYQLLLMYAKKFGIDAAKRLAAGVVNSPNDPNQADIVRNKIISQL